MDLKELKDYCNNPKYKNDRIITLLFIGGIMGVIFSFLNKDLPNEDKLLKIETVVNNYRITKENRYRKGINTEYLYFDLIVNDKKSILRIAEVSTENQHDLLKYFDFNKTKIIFKIEPDLKDKFEKGKIIKPLFLITENGHKIISYESKKNDNKVDNEFLRYFSLILIAIGLIYIPTFGLFKW